MDKEQEKQIQKFKEDYYKPSNILKKPPKYGWQFIMSREEKRFRNRWNTEKKDYTPTPKGDPRERAKEKKNKKKEDK